MGTKTIGIDFGTNFLCVAALVNGKVEVIPNEHEKRLTPCFVAFTDEERLFGETAKHQAALNHENTIYNIKQLLACKTKKPINLSELTIGFAVDRDENGEIQIPITNQKEPIKLHPQQIAAMIIKRLKELAETYLGNKVDTAVISVPAGFDEIQRRAIINAGRIAGFDDISLIKETTAAVLAYAFDHPVNVKETILVVDFGGSSIEICVATIQDKKIKILAIEGNISVGGEIIDDNLVDHYLAKFEKENITISSKKKDMVRLKEACEKIKRNISAAFRARFPNNIAMDLGLDPSKLSLTKEEFETINEDINKKVEEVLVKVLQTKNVDKKKIDQIILVGGSTRIPMVRKILEENFKGKTLNRTINPDEAVALGAAIHAASLNKTEKSIEYLISDEKVPKSDNKVEKVNDKWIEQLIESNKKFDDNDEKFQKESTARNSLEQKAYSIKQDITKRNMQKKEEELIQKCDEAIEWLNDIEEFSIEDCQERIDELQKMWEESKVRQQNKEKVKEIWRSTQTKMKSLYQPVEKKIETPTSLLKSYIGSAIRILGDSTTGNNQIRKNLRKKFDDAREWLNEKQRSNDEIKAKRNELKKAWAVFYKKDPQLMNIASASPATETAKQTGAETGDIKKQIPNAAEKTSIKARNTRSQITSFSSANTGPTQTTLSQPRKDNKEKDGKKEPPTNTGSTNSTQQKKTKEENSNSKSNDSPANKIQQQRTSSSLSNQRATEVKPIPNTSSGRNAQQQSASANQTKQKQEKDEKKEPPTNTGSTNSTQQKKTKDENSNPKANDSPANKIKQQPKSSSMSNQRATEVKPTPNPSSGRNAQQQSASANQTKQKQEKDGKKEPPTKTDSTNSTQKKKICNIHFKFSSSKKGASEKSRGNSRPKSGKDSNTKVKR